MGYHLNRLDEPGFMEGPKPMRTEFGIHFRLETCVLSIAGSDPPPQLIVVIRDDYCLLYTRHDNHLISY